MVIVKSDRVSNDTKKYSRSKYYKIFGIRKNSDLKNLKLKIKYSSNFEKENIDGRNLEKMCTNILWQPLIKIDLLQKFVTNTFFAVSYSVS